MIQVRKPHMKFKLLDLRLLTVKNNILVVLAEVLYIFFYQVRYVIKVETEI